MSRAMHLPDETASWPVGRRQAWTAVTFLSLLYVLSFADRSILALMVDPLRQDLHVSDVQIGLLLGSSFALFYGVLGIPIARLADHRDRRLLILGGAMLWGLCTLLSGFVDSFTLLVLLRIGLAVGEAALSPSAYSMISDFFSPQQRTFAASLYTSAGIFGASGSLIVGGLTIGFVEAKLPPGSTEFHIWQIVFLVLGAPSLLIALAFGLLVREPPRSGEGRGASGAALDETWSYLAQHLRIYVPLFLAAGFTQVIAGSFGAWGPTFLHRTHGWALKDAGLVIGTTGVVASIAGTILLPMITRRVAATGRRDAVPLVSAVGVLLGGCFMSAAPLQGEPWRYFLCTMSGAFCLMGAANNVPISLQVLAPPRMRATLVALCLMSITLIGLGMGPATTAAISQHLSVDGSHIGSALSIIAGLSAGVGFLFFLLARRAFGTPGTPSDEMKWRR
jgi:sugar phosphate permease